MLKGKFAFDLLKQHFRFTHTEMLNLKLSFQSLFLLGDFGTGPILVLHFESCSWVYPYIVIKLCHQYQPFISAMKPNVPFGLWTIMTEAWFPYRPLAGLFYSHTDFCALCSYCLVSPGFLGET